MNCHLPGRSPWFSGWIVVERIQSYERMKQRIHDERSVSTNLGEALYTPEMAEGGGRGGGLRSGGARQV